MRSNLVKQVLLAAPIILGLFFAVPIKAQLPCMCTCDIPGSKDGCTATAEQCTDACKKPDGTKGNAKCTQNPACGAPPKPVGIPTPLGGVTPQTLIGTVIRAVLGLTGTLALIMFVYGGFLYMTSAGNEEKVRKGKMTIVWATLGLIAVFASYSMVNFIISRLVNR